ncbi:nucleotidyltransferase [Streptomyces hygroscopicus]|uniref:nucleotidyltransferase domain-containing protein n=1 Tax=Streptomyces hygroscopicus TaxID=1912 RepID=UPI00223FE326|nr:nucleotidyltransferase domain-containing protein [Streptomyces hygroscopicus]MCW7944800.1 nucleotidyltransferase [Streptomyces hygroscopicus]
MTVPNILLSGIVGSTAYGLAHEGSDIDRLGLFAAPTEKLHGLHRPKESHVSTAPDRTLHEAAKWCRLALGGNPTAMELVWLPDELYEVRTPLGDELIGIRMSFPSASRVRDAYLGYATQQFRRIEARDGEASSADTRKRTAKHARHLKRLCHQGLELYTTGRVTLRVENPQEYHDFGERVAADPTAALPVLRLYEKAFAETRTVLPEHPDETAAEEWLRRVRAHFYVSQDAPPPRRSAGALGMQAP